MQNIRWIILAVLAVPLSIRAAMPTGALKRAYLDRLQRVHVVDVGNHDYRIDGPPAVNVVMAPDHN